MQNIKAQQKLKEENSNIKASKNRVIKKSQYLYDIPRQQNRPLHH